MTLEPALRRFEPASDQELVRELWLASMPSSWPVLPAGIAMLEDGFVALDGERTVGFAAVDLAGSVPLVLVAPACQRTGIGTALIDAALARLRAAGVGEASAGNGGAGYIWPGVPLSVPGAADFFAATGWRTGYDTLDLVADLSEYRPPASTDELAGRAGVRIARARKADASAVLAFEAAQFPSWLPWFEVEPERALLARDQAGQVAGTLLFDGPGAATVYEPMLGPRAGTIGCVGVAPPLHGRGIGTALVARASELLRDAGTGNCHISWAARESFYVNVGYRPWQRYRGFRRPTGTPGHST
jgi:GNAT superfamily N-acetyltransferase